MEEKYFLNNSQKIVQNTYLEINLISYQIIYLLKGRELNKYLFKKLINT